MARATHVKKARKDNKAHGIKKGEEYWHWSFRVGLSSVKHFSKTPPRPSQLTNSEFMSAALALEEEIGDLRASATLADDRDEIVGRINELADEEDGKVSNMPDSLQQGETGTMMTERAETLRAWAQELEAIDIPDLKEEDGHECTEECPEGCEDEEEPTDNMDEIEDALDEMKQTSPSF